MASPTRWRLAATGPERIGIVGYKLSDSIAVSAGWRIRAIPAAADFLQWCAAIEDGRDLSAPSIEHIRGELIAAMPLKAGASRTALRA
jgi:hypothetical protein